MSNLKTVVKGVLPGGVIRFADRMITPFEMMREALSDAGRYMRSSTSRDGTVGTTASLRNLEAQLTKDYHRVEKGLALPSPKRPFGAAVQMRLESLLPIAKAQAPDAPFVRYAEDALTALLAWNEGKDVDELVSPIVPAAVLPIAPPNLHEFFETRRSVRNFDRSKPVDLEVLRHAVSLAQNTPSVCNRQAGKIHLFTLADEVQELLAHQNGNAGFRQSVPALAIITVDSRLFTGTTERNQRWIDGGLFAMSLVWALHGVGLQTCMLNWSMNNRESTRLRQVAGLQNSEDIIMMIAIGHGTEGYRVARSERRSIDEVLIHREGNSVNAGIEIGDNN